MQETIVLVCGTITEYIYSFFCIGHQIVPEGSAKSAELARAYVRVAAWFKFCGKL